jgi:carotenoid cleavage dioxygenase-like enzyme
MALGEHNESFELDPQDFERGRFINTGDKRTAHPKIDPETGEMLWFAYFAGPEPLSNLIDYGVTDKSGNVTRRDRFAGPYAAIIHDFMVTRNYVMFPISPLTGDPERAMKGLPPLAWEPTKRRLRWRNETRRRCRFHSLVRNRATIFSPHDERLGRRRENSL